MIKREYGDYIQDILDSIIDISILWKVATEELPSLKSEIQRILKNID